MCVCAYLERRRRRCLLSRLSPASPSEVSAPLNSIVHEGDCCGERVRGRAVGWGESEGWEESEGWCDVRGGETVRGGERMRGGMM